MGCNRHFNPHGVAPAQHSASFAWDQMPRPNSAWGEENTRLAHGLGELHGRNLASALMRSRVHNRNRDRGGKSIQLAWLWAIALGPSGGTGGGPSKKSPLTGEAAVIYEYTPGAIAARATADGPAPRV